MSSATQPIGVIAKLLDLSERRVQQLSREGVIPKAERGQYDLIGSVRGYVRYLRDQAQKAQAGAPDYAAERARFIRARADLAEMEAEEKRGSLIASEDAETAWIAVLALLRTRMLGLPDRLAPQLHAEKCTAGVRDVMRGAIREVLEELADTHVGPEQTDIDGQPDGHSYGSQITTHRDDLEIADHIRACGMEVEVKAKDKRFSHILTLKPTFRWPDQICRRGHDMDVVGRHSSGNCAECGRQFSMQWKHNRPVDPVLPDAKPFSLRLRELGLCKSRKTPETGKHVPPAYLRASRDQRLALGAARDREQSAADLHPPAGSALGTTDLMSAVAMALDALFTDGNIGVDAVYTPEGGTPVLIRVVARRADEITGFGDARLWSETTRVDLRVADVANPRPGDRIEIDGDAYLIQGEPVRDRERLVWTVDLSPA